MPERLPGGALLVVATERCQRPGLPQHLLPHAEIMILPENFSKYYEGVELLKLTGAMI